MRNTNIKKFNTSQEKPIEIKGLVKNGITKEMVFSQSKIVVSDENLKMSYIVFVLQKMSLEYNLSYENILLLVYLKELGLFRLQLDLLDKKPQIGHFENKGFIEQDYSIRGKTLYKLTSEGLCFVQEFYSLMSSPDPFLSFNREVDTGLDKNMKSFLDGYFR